MTNTTTSNRLHRAVVATLCAAPLTLAACIDLEDGEDLDDDHADLASDPSLDEVALHDTPEVASGEVPELPPGCTAGIDNPTFDGFTVGSLGSWSGCPASAQFTVELRQHRSWWPDRSLDKKSATGSSGSLVVTERCSRGGPSYVFATIAYRNGWARRTARFQVPCHF